MSETWFTADLHIGHTNIIEYSHRPFSSVEEMDEALVENWNAVVRPGDSVYCLGDFALCRPERAVTFARQLKGQKFMVWGNHDKYCRKDPAFVGQWVWCKDLADVKVGEQRVVLSHYAFRVWNQSHRGAWNLHGHSHGTLMDEPHLLQLDVGVDCWDYTPVSFDVLKERMSHKTWAPVDHHGERGERP